MSIRLFFYTVFLIMMLKNAIAYIQQLEQDFIVKILPNLGKLNKVTKKVIISL